MLLTSASPISVLAKVEVMGNTGKTDEQIPERPREYNSYKLTNL